MPNTNLNRRIILQKSQGFTQEALILFTQWESLGTPASESRKLVVNNTILGLKSIGAWDELDCFYMWAAHSKAASLIDWKNPTTRAATLTNDYAGSFVVDSYMKGNGSNFRINSNYNPGDGGTYKFTQNSSSFGYYVKLQVAGGGTVIDVGASTAFATGNQMLMQPTTYQSLAVNNTGATYRGPVALSPTGLRATVRTSSNLFKVLPNGFDIQNVNNTDTSIAIANLQFAILANNVNGVYSGNSQKTTVYNFFGSGNINVFKLGDSINKNYLIPLAINLPKRVTFNGNSFTDQTTVSYVQRVVANINSNETICWNVKGISGQTTPQMQTNAALNIFTYATTSYTKDILFAWELTNDMAANTSNATTCYNNIVAYCVAARAALPTVKIIVATMMPRNSASINNANRQNDLNLLDDTTLNGKIRNHLVQDGYADAICDTASDLTMGIYSNGVVGVGEKNTTYYNADQIHPNTTGFNLLADTYITPSINAFL